MSEVSLKDFYDQIDRHDWSYMMSDDGHVYRRGSTEESRLQGIAKQSPEHQALWDAFRKYWWSGDHMGTEKAPKPERPAS